MCKGIVNCLKMQVVTDNVSIFQAFHVFQVIRVVSSGFDSCPDSRYNGIPDIKKMGVTLREEALS